MDVIVVVLVYIYQMTDIIIMSELPANFDFHEFLNKGIKDEFSPIMENIVQLKMRKNRINNLNTIIEDFFKSKETKSVSAS